MFKRANSLILFLSLLLNAILLLAHFTSFLYKFEHNLIDSLQTLCGRKRDIYRTTKVTKCDSMKTNVTSWSHLYWDDNDDAKQYGCKVVETLDWALSLRSFEKRVYSQNGEDGVLEEIFAKIGEESRFFVEFGVQNGSICNTRYFREAGWKGVMFDNDNSNPEIGLYRASVWVDNVAELFRQRKVLTEFDLLSIDTDFNDFWNLREILLAGYRPRVVIVEVNVASGPYSSFVVPRKFAERHAMFVGTRWFGASVLAYAKLMYSFGYQLLHIESAVINAIFIKSSEIHNIDLARAYWQRKQFEGLSAKNAHKNDKKNRPYEHICKNTPCDTSDDW